MLAKSGTISKRRWFRLQCVDVLAKAALVVSFGEVETPHMSSGIGVVGPLPNKQFGIPESKFDWPEGGFSEVVSCVRARLILSRDAKNEGASALLKFERRNCTRFLRPIVN